MGTRLNRLGEAVLTSTHNLCFEQKYENYQNFSSENFHFLVVKISVYLKRHVFVMVAYNFVLNLNAIYALYILLFILVLLNPDMLS